MEQAVLAAAADGSKETISAQIYAGRGGGVVTFDRRRWSLEAVEFRKQHQGAAKGMGASFAFTSEWPRSKDGLERTRIPATIRRTGFTFIVDKTTQYRRFVGAECVEDQRLVEPCRQNFE
jgi:hypothetical protein